MKGWLQWPWSRRWTVAIGAVLLILTGAATLFPGVPGPPHPVTHCRSGDVLTGVYIPWRLQVLQECVTITGVVTSVAQVADFDFHIDVRPDPPYRKMLNDVNISDKAGDLVVEVIPFDRARITVPRVGDHVAITGAFVYDRIHGWNEIHPAWRFVLL